MHDSLTRPAQIAMESKVFFQKVFLPSVSLLIYILYAHFRITWKRLKVLNCVISDFKQYNSGCAKLGEEGYAQFLQYIFMNQEKADETRGT